MILPAAKGKSYGICGLGKSGRAMAAALLKARANVWAWDDNSQAIAAAQKEFAALQLKPIESWPWEKFSALLMSPGIPLDYPKLHPAVALARKHQLPIISDIELLFTAQGEAQYIGITGTNGKSTTTALIGHILQACGKKTEVGGNLGTPVLSLKPLKKDGTYVLELSSYQLELLQTAKMNVAVLLNISPDHIDHHGSMERYVEAKQHIFDRQGKRDTAILGIDDATSEAIARDLIAGRRQCVIPISAKQKILNGVYVKNGVLHNNFALSEQIGDIGNITSLRGEHNWQNAAAAYAACYAAGCRHEEIIAAMQTYPGLPHRMQYLGEVAGVQFVNDSKATNADAAEKALKSYDYIYWILGGVAKEGGIESLAKYFPKVRHAYLIGAAAKEFAGTLGGKVKFTQCGDLDTAFAAASADALKDKVKGAAVLLAPACASFDQYPNFEVRGEAFIKLFESLRKKGVAA